MRVLVLPDSAHDADSVRQSLLAARPDSEIEVCEAQRAVAWLASHDRCDIVLMGGSALDGGVVPAIRSRWARLPIAVLVPPDDRRMAARALLAGADESIQRGESNAAELASWLQRLQQRDHGNDRGRWRLLYAGPDSDLRKQMVQQLATRVLLMSLSADGRLVPTTADPSEATGLIVDARHDPDGMLLGFEHLHTSHPSLPVVMVADDRHHHALLRAGVDECVPAGADVQRVLLAVERVLSRRQVAGELLALRARENRLRALVEYLPEAVVLVTPARTVLAVNLAGLELLGVEDARQIIGQELGTWLDADPEHDLASVIHAVSAGDVRHMRARTRHGVPRTVEMRGVPFRREPDQPADVIVVLRDVSDVPAQTDTGDVPIDRVAHEQLTRELDEGRARLADTMRELEQARDETRLAAERIAQLEVERDRAVGITRDVDARIAALERALADQRDRASALDEVLVATREQVSVTEQRLRDVDASRQEAAADAASRLAEAHALLATQASALARYEEAARLAEARAADLQRALSEREDADVAHQEAVAALELTLVAERTRVGELTDRLGAERRDLEARIAEIEAQRVADGESARHELEAARGDLQATRDRLAALELELGARAEGDLTAETALQDLRDTLTHERDARAAQEAALHDAHAARDRAEQDVGDLQRRLAALEAELSDRQATEQAALESAAHLRDVLAEERTQAGHLVHALQATRDQLTAAAERMVDIDAEGTGATAARVAELERELDRSVAARAAADARAARAVVDLDALDAARTDAELRASDLMRRLADLEREHAEATHLLERRSASERESAQWHTDLPELRDAQRQVAALEGRLSDSQRVRAQALALETEVSELRSMAERARQLDLELESARAELAAVQQVPATLESTVDAETRWLLYEVASIGHLTTTPEARILGANDIAARLLGHFSRDALHASGLLPEPLLLAAGAFTQRPTRFEVCLQHGDEGPLHWLVGLATPHAGLPATVTWMLIDVSEQRMQARRARFLRRMEAMTHVLSSATAECSTLVDRAGAVLDTVGAEGRVCDDVDLDGARTALARTQGVLAQLSGFARRRARRPSARDVGAILDEAGPVLVHVAGQDVNCSIRTAEDPLHATLEPAEFEQFLTALVLAGRDALPLGGRLEVETRAIRIDAQEDGDFFAQPAVELVMQADGYGAVRPVSAAALEELASRFGGRLDVHDQQERVTFRLRMPRVFLIA